jgi:hypothetical protein
LGAGKSQIFLNLDSGFILKWNTDFQIFFVLWPLIPELSQNKNLFFFFLS